MKQKKFSLTGLLMLLLFIVIAALTLLPFFSITLASFRPADMLMRKGLGLNINFSEMTLDNYRYLFTGDHDYIIWYFNSIKLTVVQTVSTLLVSAFVAYGFAMYDFRGKNLIFTCVLLVMMIPIEIIILPLYKLAISLKLIDKIWGIILPGIAGPLPIFFFRQYLSGIPRDFLDAARVDGCTEYGTFFRIIMPLMKPSFAAMGIFVGMNSWNALLWPMIVLRSSEKFTLPIGLTSLINPYRNNYSLLLSGSVFAVIPIMILFLAFQKQFIAGMTAGGVKG